MEKTKKVTVKLTASIIGTYPDNMTDEEIKKLWEGQYKEVINYIIEEIVVVGE